MQKEYIYAVSRIHSREMQLLDKSDLLSLLHASDFESCLKTLKDKGYGSENSNNDADSMLKSERKKMWELMSELTGGKDDFKVLRYKYDFHNLKASIKSAVTDTSCDNLLIHEGTVDAGDVLNAVKNREFDDLPDFLRECGKEAFKQLLETSNGQLCDIIIDKACLEHIYKTGMLENDDVFHLYAKITVFSCDIKTAVRCALFKKNSVFLDNALTDCALLDKEQLKSAALNGVDSICDYLSTTEFADSKEALKTGVSNFEKWCDNYLINSLKPQKNEHFSIGPLVAYILAKENEIKALKLILSGKLNSIDNSIIEERLRDMYV